MKVNEYSMVRLIFVFCLFRIGSVMALASDNTASQQEGPIHENTSLNAIIGIAAHCDKQDTLPSAIKNAQFDGEFATELSQQGIVTAISRMGLSVSLNAEGTAMDIMSAIDDGSLVVTRRRENKDKRYILIYRTERGNYVIDDYPQVAVSISDVSLIQTLNYTMEEGFIAVHGMPKVYHQDKGELVRIKEGGAPKQAQTKKDASLQTGDELQLPTVYVDERVPHGLYEPLQVTIPLENIGKETVLITSVKGSCSCVKLAEYPNSIEPGKRVELQLHVDSHRYEDREQFASEIVIESTDRKLRAAVVKLQFAFDNSHAIFLVPGEKNFGPVDPVTKHKLITSLSLYRATDSTKKVAIVGVQVSDKRLKIVTSGCNVERGKFVLWGKADVTVDLDEKSIGPETLYGTILTDDPVFSKIPVVVRYTSVPSVSLQ